MITVTHLWEFRLSPYGLSHYLQRIEEDLASIIKNVSILSFLIKLLDNNGE